MFSLYKNQSRAKKYQVAGQIPQLRTNTLSGILADIYVYGSAELELYKLRPVLRKCKYYNAIAHPLGLFGKILFGGVRIGSFLNSVSWFKEEVENLHGLEPLPSCVQRPL